MGSLHIFTLLTVYIALQQLCFFFFFQLLLLVVSKTEHLPPSHPVSMILICPTKPVHGLAQLTLFFFYCSGAPQNENKEKLIKFEPCRE